MMNRKTFACIAALAAISACSSSTESAGAAGTRTVEGRGRNFAEAGADAARNTGNGPQAGSDGVNVQVQGEGGKYREATAAEADQALQMAVQAMDELRAKRSASEIAILLDTHWRKKGLASAYDRNGFQYRITDGGLSATASKASQESGIKAYAWLQLQAATDMYASARANYLVFDSKAAAKEYHARMARDMNSRTDEYHAFDIGVKGYPSFNLRCLYITGANRGVSCHYMGPDDRVIGSMYFPGGPVPSPGKGVDATSALFADQAVVRHIGAATGVAWSYLSDAYFD